MPTINSNLLPTTTGLSLGSLNQKWVACLSNAFQDVIQSNTPNPALSGFIRMAFTDDIAWRNSTNTSDVLLSTSGAAANNVPSDCLVFSGNGYIGDFISNTLNPAASGAIRLATGDAITIRNAANSADIVALQKNADETFTVGDGSHLFKPFATISIAANPASNGILRMANIDQILWRNAANSGDEGIAVDTNDRMAVSTSNGLLLNGANPNLRFGGSTSAFPMLKRTGTSIAARLADDSGDASLQVGSIVKLGGFTPVSNGVGVLVARTFPINQIAAIGSTPLFTTLTAGLYRLNWYANIKTVAGTSSTLGPLGVAYVDAEGIGQTIVAGAVTSAGAVATSSAGNTTATMLMGISVALNLSASTAISYTFGYASSAANIMAYDLNIMLEFLG